MANCRGNCSRFKTRKISRMFSDLVGIGYKACRSCQVMVQTNDSYCHCCGSKFSITPTRSGKKSEFLRTQAELVKRY